MSPRGAPPHLFHVPGFRRLSSDGARGFGRFRGTDPTAGDDLSALITGATADRSKFGSYALLITLWSILVDAPAARWVVEPRRLDLRDGCTRTRRGCSDPHQRGRAALAVVLAIGNRKGHGSEPMPPHNLPLTVLGTGILWFGWFGFNTGSALAANGVAAQALVNTQLSAATGMLRRLLVERTKTGHATVLGACSGAVAGLVAITPCAGFVGGVAPLIIGTIAGMAWYFALSIEARMNWDDTSTSSP